MWHRLSFSFELSSSFNQFFVSMIRILTISSSSLQNSWKTSIFQVVVPVVTLFIVGSVIRLLYPIVYPTVITYPWPDYDLNDNNKSNKYDNSCMKPQMKVYEQQQLQNQLQQQKHQRQKGVVALAGSFNPPHNGHLSILSYLVQRYEQVIVVVGVNPKKTYLVSPSERATLVRCMIDSDIPYASKRIHVKVVTGYIWKSMKPLGVQYFIRGIRSWEKDGTEERQLQILNTWGPLLYGPFWWPIPTIYVQGIPKYNHISSTYIRTLLSKQQQQQQQRLIMNETNHYDSSLSWKNNAKNNKSKNDNSNNDNNNRDVNNIFHTSTCSSLGNDYHDERTNNITSTLQSGLTARTVAADPNRNSSSCRSNENNKNLMVLSELIPTSIVEDVARLYSR